jgi:hypothetical protein
MLDTLRKNPVLKNHCAEGLQAIESKHRQYVQLKVLQVSCSLNIDDAYRKAEPQHHRWDYYMHVSDDTKLAYAVFFEPHTCTTKEVSCFLEKHEWLLEKIKSPLSFLVRGTGRQFYFWIPSSGNKIATHSPQYKRLKKTNIKIVKVIHDRDLNSV